MRPLVPNEALRSDEEPMRILRGLPEAFESPEALLGHTDHGVLISGSVVDDGERASVLFLLDVDQLQLRPLPIRAVRGSISGAAVLSEESVVYYVDAMREAWHWEPNSLQRLWATGDRPSGEHGYVHPDSGAVWTFVQGRVNAPDRGGSGRIHRVSSTGDAQFVARFGGAVVDVLPSPNEEHVLVLWGELSSVAVHHRRLAVVDAESGDWVDIDWIHAHTRFSMGWGPSGDRFAYSNDGRVTVIQLEPAQPVFLSAPAEKFNLIRWEIDADVLWAVGDSLVPVRIWPR